MIQDQNFIHAYRPLTLIQASGEDAFSFLQGQFTNELRQGEGAAAYGLWLNQKGKVVADSHVLNLGGNNFCLVSSSSAAAVVRQRLEAYIVADDVVLSDETETARGLLLGGAHSKEMIAACFGAAPGAGQYLRSDEMLVFPGSRLRQDHFEIIGPEKKLDEFRRQFVARGGVEVDAGEVELARILAGIPAIPRDLGPADLPNEGGLEETAISYAKGCYLGQEVMARLKNLGQVRRRLHLVGGEGGPPSPSTPLFQGQRKAGEIRSAAGAGDGFVALAMLSLVGLDQAAGFSLAPDAPPTMGIRRHG